MFSGSTVACYFIAVVGRFEGGLQKLGFPIPRVCPTGDTYWYYYVPRDQVSGVIIILVDT